MPLKFQTDLIVSWPLSIHMLLWHNPQDEIPYSILSLIVSFFYFRNVCVRVCARMVWHSLLSVARGCTPTFVCGEQRSPALSLATLFPWVWISQCRHACSHTWLFTWTCVIWMQILSSAQPMLFPPSRPNPSWAIHSRQSGAEPRAWGHHREYGCLGTLTGLFISIEILSKLLSLGKEDAGYLVILVPPRVIPRIKGIYICKTALALW